MATKSEQRLHEEESKIPVFTVIKNGAILKNIFIVNNSQPRLPFISPLKPVASVRQPDREFEEILIVGRHPDCNVMLTHPSISRFHLQIASNQSLMKLSVIDLSSVHGTWVSGKKIDPGVRVELNEGDTLKIGVSSRVYRLHWIPLSCAYDFESSYVSASDLSLMEEKAGENAVIEENEMGDFQDENYLPVENKRIEEKNKLVVEMKEVEEDQGKCEFAQCDNSMLVENKKIQPLDFLEGSLSPLLSDEDFGLMVKKEIPSPPLPENPIFTLFDENDEGFESPFKDVEEQNEISSHCGGFYEPELAKFSSPTKGVILGSENSECDKENLEGPELYCVADRVHHQATETPDKSEDQKISTKDHEQKDVLCEYSATAATESVNSSLPMGEVVSECQTPESLSAAGRLSQTEIVDNSPIKSDQRSSCGSIWSRRGKPASIQLRLGGSKGGASLAGVGFEDEQHNKENAEDKSVSKALFCTPDKENFTPNTLLLKSLKKKGKLVEEEKHSKPDRSSVSKVTFSPNIHPEDLIASSDKEEIFTPDKENITPNTLLLKSLKKKGKLKEVKHSTSRRLLSSKVTSSTNIRSEKDLIASSVKEEIITLDKENITPNTLPPRSLKKKGKLEEVKHSKSGLFSSKVTSRPNIFPPEEWLVNSDKEENFTPDRENITPNTLLPRSLKKKGELEEVKHSKSSLLPLKVTSSPNLFPEEEWLVTSDKEENFTPDKENITPNTLLLKSLQKKGKLEVLKHPHSCRTSSPKSTFSLDIPPKEEEWLVTSDKEETFTPDKENITPNTLLLKSLQKKGRLEVLKHPYSCGSSSPKFTTSLDIPPKEDTIALSDKESNSCGVLQELDFPKQPISSNQVMLEQESMITKRRPERVPFQTLLENSADKSRSETLAPSSATRSSASINYTQIMEKKVVNPLSNHSAREGTRSWTMVVDTATLLDKESRKLLQLLQGLKGTRLIIPRMVIRELDCLKRRGSLFRRNTEASLVLEWIEQCMADTTWWIHVQSSVEDGRLTAATPPATPSSSFSNGSGEFPFGTTSSMPFLCFSSLMEIASPSTEDHILDCALLCKTMKTDGQLVLLSNDITLKIKAMAEGLICETVQEFRNSLMNPFSERFLWADSSPRGRTWSVLDDVVLRERYNRCPLRRGESAKGLKLILLHNSHYRQMSPIS
ncbi:hypothetical protein UlMin_034698 [Ulmus minor]